MIPPWTSECCLHENRRSSAEPLISHPPFTLKPTHTHTHYIHARDKLGSVNHQSSPSLMRYQLSGSCSQRSCWCCSSLCTCSVKDLGDLLAFFLLVCNHFSEDAGPPSSGSTPLTVTAALQHADMIHLLSD